MTTHILSMTYGPKIEGVRNGTIRQTVTVAFECELSVRDVEGKLDGEYELMDYPLKCPNAQGEISVCWNSEQ